MKYTQGKWELRIRPTQHLISSMSETGEFKKIICEIAVLENDDYEANAQLIAAAPETKKERDDFLEALKEILNDLRKGRINMAKNICKTAIKKEQGL